MTKRTRSPIEAGHYYVHDVLTGTIQEDANDRGLTPEVVICRRVADFPDGRAPSGAALAWCQHCGALVAYSPKGPHLDRPRQCMQCCAITPVPFVPPTKGAA